MNDEPRPAPWKKAAPKSKSSSIRLTPASKAWAKAAARRASRPYPNLTDNMNAARRQKESQG
jgi:hypothetical protein